MKLVKPPEKKHIGPSSKQNESAKPAVKPTTKPNQKSANVDIFDLDLKGGSPADKPSTSSEPMDFLGFSP